MRDSYEKLFVDLANKNFEKVTLEIFNYQAINCPTYRDFIRYMGINPRNVKQIKDIPFLPVEFFKTQDIICEDRQPELTFSSSATTGTVQSSHHVVDRSIYEQSYRSGFSKFYGDISQYVILALLPSYQEREGSSLIYMVDDLIRLSNHPLSEYVLNDYERLFKTLNDLKSMKTPVMLIGVTYALLDFIEHYSVKFPELIVMETGGMKGRRKEMIREELHERLCEGFGVPSIHSEYGMTELLSQAYSTGKGIFRCPPWMKVLIRDTNDPLSYCENGQTGGLNIIDLANRYSCSFIATQDLGKTSPDGSFEVMGRFDNSDIRGCNLLVQ